VSIWEPTLRREAEGSNGKPEPSGSRPEGPFAGEDVPQYLVAIQHPENYDPSREGEAMIRDIGALEGRRCLPGSGRGASVPQDPAD